MRTLLDISDDLRALADLIDETGGELSPESEAALDQWFAEATQDRDRKLDGYAAFIRELTLRAAARREEMERLAIHRGYPVPWFVAWIDGVPEFRAMDGQKFRAAIRDKLCWVCGEKLGRFMTFVVGPMCGINRTSAEPPCHQDCAMYSVRNCPFLSKPHMERRENDLPEGTRDPGGHMIRRNPGVTLLWTTREYGLFSDGRGGVLIQMGEPTATDWWTKGQPATRERTDASVAGGIGTLEEIARQQDGAMADLARRRQWLEARYPS